jgi:hypothetical protein
MASVVLVFGMVLSLLAANDGADFKTMGFRLYSRNRLERYEFSGSMRLNSSAYWPWVEDD